MQGLRTNIVSVGLPDDGVLLGSGTLLDMWLKLA